MASDKSRIGVWLKPRKDAFVDVISYYRGVALPAVALTFAFAIFDQTHEIYLQLAEDGAHLFGLLGQQGLAMRISRIFLGFVLLGIFCLTLWHNARWLSLRTEHSWWQEDGGEEGDLRSPTYWRSHNLLIRLTPRVLGALPAGGMVLGLALTAESSEAGAPGVRMTLWIAALIALIIGAAFLWYVIWRKRGSRDYGADQKMFDRWWRIVLYGFSIFALLVTFFRVFPAQLFGPVAILCLFGIGLSVILTVLTADTHRRHIPWVFLLVALAVGLSVIDVNDNHRLDMAPAAAVENAPENARADPAAAFREWSKARGAEAGKDYDVYVVAAQGGGLYAAYHTAILLAQAQDMNPEFADHLFAISGVSGGSVGAAVFHAVLTSGKCPRKVGTCHVDMVRAALRRDFLSPTLASMLFPDFTARFLPLPGDWLTLLSRARALEAGFASALEAGEADPNVPLMNSWRPGSGAEARPLLLLNTTDVDTGERMVMTPLLRFYENDKGLAPVETLAEVLGCANTGANCASPRLLTAALVSARFPIVTPAARLALAERDDRRYVDGGYFENSGVETAFDLLSQIGPHEGYRFHLIALKFPDRNSEQRKRSYWLGELMSPVRAFLNARSARGELPKRRAWERQDWIDYHGASLDDENAQFTLGWVLSARTFEQIEFELWNDAVGEQINLNCLKPVQRYNRHLLRRLVWELPWGGEDSGGHGLPECKQAQ